MGWLHVDKQGKGVNFREITKIKPDFVLPSDDVLVKFFNQKDVEFIDKKDVYHSLAYLGFVDYSWQLDYIKRNLKDDGLEVNFENFSKIFDEHYSESFSEYVCNVLECLFCAKYNYPEGCFRGCMDYNGDYMFYCCVEYPLDVYNESLAKLTSDIYINQIHEFLFELTGDEYFKTLRLEHCEEYIKE